MFEAKAIEFSILLPSSDFMVFWLICGSLSLLLMNILFIMHTAQESYLATQGLLGYPEFSGDNKYFLRFEMTCVVIFLLGFLSLICVCLMLFAFLRDQAKGGREKRLREARERILRDF